jgi:type II restriction/modification system DNA methylase subunit YeeA
MDAILAYDDAGNPVEPEWPEAEVIIGNPPFLGDKKMRSGLGSGYVQDVRATYEGRVPGGADYVTYWFERARGEIADRGAKRAGLLATNSVRFGASRGVLERIKDTGDIFLAWSDRPWVLDGAAVRVSIIGFDNGSEEERRLDGRSVRVINADLSYSVDLTVAKCLTENKDLAFIGTQKTGAFELLATTAQVVLSDLGNPNGRSNSDVVKPWINASDITGRPRNRWTVDFGVDMPLEEAAQYERPFEHVVRAVKPARDKSSEPSLREQWWLMARPRPAMRKALSGLQNYIATPRVAKHRLFVLQDVNTIPDSRIVVIARDDYYFLGLLHSRPHELWTLRTASRHGVGNDPTYNAQSCFETFPFPWPPGKEPPDDPRVEAIAAAARELNEKREAWLNPPGLSEKELKQRTLTNLYNQMPTWLRLLNARLDRAVLDAYGWPHDLSDEAVLERLLALNLERASEL